MEKYLTNIGIENHVESKYDNRIVPEIKDIIRDYLFNNPDKFNIYISDKINVIDLIRTISRNLSNRVYVTDAMVMDEIIKYVEVDHGAK